MLTAAYGNAAPLLLRYNMLAQYYDAASLSFRTMIWHIANRNVRTKGVGSPCFPAGPDL